MLRCLAKSPKARPQTALELAQELCSAVGPALRRDRCLQRMEGLGRRRSSGVVEMPFLEVRAPRRARITGMMRDLRARMRSKQRALLVGTAALVMGLVSWLVLSASRQGPVAEASAVIEPTVVQQAGHTELVVQSTPLAAEVFDEKGTRLGVTPHRLTLEPGTSVKVRLKRPGYRAAERVVSADTRERTILIPLEAEPPKKPRPSPTQTKPRKRPR